MSNNDSEQVTVAIPEPLREIIGGHRELTAAPGTVADVLVQLTEQYPELGPVLVTESGRLADATVLAVDGEDIRFADGLDTPVRAGQTLVIVQTLAI
ncbi:MAG: MoaD/ThiS family protein [Armatimonadota bacterium]